MNYESPFAGENGVPEPTPQAETVEQFGMQWKIWPVPISSRVSRDTIDVEIPMFREPVSYKELGGLGVVNALPDFYFEDWK